MGEEATQNDLIDEAKSIIGDICADHIAAAEAFVSDPQLKEALWQDVKNECQELVEYIQASKRFKLEINSRSKDRVVSFGERLSCRFMTYVLRDRVRTFFFVSEEDDEKWATSQLIYATECRGRIRGSRGCAAHRRHITTRCLVL